ncbi:MAG: hypothetical protein LBR74_09385 [Eubacterium sp.]|jgi:hypothetical protein|nr:hypothetical protein [Eubacterium sp.]
MKLFQILNGRCHFDMTALYHDLNDAKSHYSSDIIIVETPDYVFQDWGFDETKTEDERFIKPVPPEGWAYDEDTGTFFNIASRKIDELIALLTKYQQNLDDTDYKVTQLAEGIITQAEYAATGLKEIREEWRAEVRTLTDEIENLSQNSLA